MGILGPQQTAEVRRAAFPGKFAPYEGAQPARSFNPLHVYEFLVVFQLCLGSKEVVSF